MMKKYIFLLSMLWVSLSMAQQLTQAEYFFDTDPGPGNGNQISFTATNDFEFDSYLSVDGLSQGYHSFHFRIKDSSGNWSQVLTKGIYIPSINGAAALIDQIEYFYDTDPGYGEGTQYTDFSPGDYLFETFVAEMPYLQEGTHLFNIRLKDSNGFWSQTFQQSFQLLNCDLSLSGEVKYADQSPVNNGKVVLYQYFGIGSAVAIDTVTISNGSYIFNSVCPMSEYFIKVIPPLTTDFLPTYYGDAPYWEEASTLATETSSVSGVNITAVNFTDLTSGTSRVGGHIWLAEGKGQPVKNVDVVLEYNDPNDKGDYLPVALNISNEEGAWEIPELPNGDYRIKVEIPGLAMDTTYYVSITAANTFIDNLDFWVDYNNGIFVEFFNTNDLNYNDQVVLYPNPSSDGVFKISDQSGQLQIEEINIYNYSGQNISGSLSKSELERTPLPIGFYLIKIKTTQGILVRKVVVQ